MIKRTSLGDVIAVWSIFFGMITAVIFLAL